MTTEREKFEQEMAALGYHQPPALYRDGTYRDTCYSAGWDAWQAAKRDAALDALAADSQAMGAYDTPTRSQKLRDAGFTRRPSWRSLPKDGDDDSEPSADASAQAAGSTQTGERGGV